MAFSPRIIFCLVAAVSLLPVSTAQSPFADEPATNVRLRESIFRYMFHEYVYGKDVKVHCIQPERPQPEKFLRRFADSTIRVVWSSDCELTGPMNGAREKKTGERALIMTIHEIRLSGNEAIAKVEAFSDGIAANWNTLHLILTNGRWVVKSDKSDGVS